MAGDPITSGIAQSVGGALPQAIVGGMAQRDATRRQDEMQERAYNIQAKQSALEQQRYDQRRDDYMRNLRYNQRQQQMRNQLLLGLASRYGGGRNLRALLQGMGGGGGGR